MQKSNNGCVVGFVTCAILGFALAGFATWKNYDIVEKILRATSEMPDKWARALGQVFQTKVSIEGHSFTLSRSQIKELALLQNQIVVVTKYQRSFAGVNATIIVRGVYKAKVGFDLETAEPIRIGLLGRLDEASLPKPKLLSLEEIKREVFYKSENPVNLPNGSDVEKALDENIGQARKEIEGSGMLEEADRQLVTRLTDLIEVQQLLDATKPVDAQKEDSAKEVVTPSLSNPPLK